MSEKTLQFNNIILHKKKFHKSKEPIDLLSVDLDQIVVSYEFKHNAEGFKYFIGYLECEIVKPLCIILPQMWDKFDKIWDVTKDKLGIEFHSEPVYEYKYFKAKVREFDGVMKTNFLNNGMPKESMHYSCIACITIDSVINFNEKNHLQVYLEECKYKIKETQMSKFIKNELRSGSDLDSDLDSDSYLDLDDKELMTKFKKIDIDSDSNSEKNQTLV